MGLRGDAVIAGIAEYAPERKYRGERRFTLEQWYLTGATNERDSAILVDGFRRFGIDASSNEWGIQRTSQEERAKTSGMLSL